MASTLVRLKAALSLGGLTPWQVLSRTWNKMVEHEVPTRAAAIAFYAMLASVPFLALLLTLVVQLLPDLSPLTGHATRIEDAAVRQFRHTLQRIFPPEAYQVVADQVSRIKHDPPIGLLSVGLAVIVWTASSLFLAIMDAMNVMYGVTESRSFLRLRLTAMFMTVVQAVILLGSLLAVVAGPEILSWLGYEGQSAPLALLLQWTVIAIMVLISFALTFYVGPDANQKWEWMTPGSLLGTFLILGFSLGFRVYVRYWGQYDKMYGSLGGVMVLLLWLWVSSVVLLSAAQLNKVIEDASPVGKSFGQKRDPTPPPDLAAIPPRPLSGEPSVADESDGQPASPPSRSEKSLP